MAKVKEFENILNDCLDRLIKGKTIKSCLASYPQYAAELEPLLKTAQETILAAAIQPRPEFRQRAAHEYQAAIRNLPVKKGWTFKWQLRWVLPVAILIVLLGSGSGTVLAASNALPDSPLYSVKLATESVQMTFTFSNESKAELYARFIDYRVEEIVKMVEKGDLNLVTLTTDRINSNIKAIAAMELTGNRSLFVGSYGLMATERQTQTATEPSLNDGKLGSTPPSITTNTTTEGPPTELTGADLLVQRLLDDMDRNLQILQDQLETAPAEFQAALQHAIDVIEDGYWQVINSLG
jgi:hypothetical protein